MHYSLSTVCPSSCMFLLHLPCMVLLPAVIGQIIWTQLGKLSTSSTGICHWLTVNPVSLWSSVIGCWGIRYPRCPFEGTRQFFGSRPVFAVAMTTLQSSRCGGAPVDVESWHPPFMAWSHYSAHTHTLTYTQMHIYKHIHTQAHT